MDIDVKIGTVVDELKARVEDLRNISQVNIVKYLESTIPEIYTNLNDVFHKWQIMDFDACPDCIANSEFDPYDLGPGINKIGDEYPSGDTEPPAHKNCRCFMVELTQDNTNPIEVEETSITGAGIIGDYLPINMETELQRIVEETVQEVII